MLKVMKYRRQAKLARRMLQTLIGGALDLVILTQSGLGEESQRCASDLLQRNKSFHRVVIDTSGETS